MTKYLVPEKKLVDLLRARCYVELTDIADHYIMHGIDASFFDIENAYIAKALNIEVEEVEERQLTLKDVALEDLKQFKEVEV